MKIMPTVDDTIVLMFKYIDNAYRHNEICLSGVIQLHLKHQDAFYDYYINVTEKMLDLKHGINHLSTVKLKSDLSDFLDLAAGKLNPAVGILSMKLRFSGNIFFFKKVMKHDNMFTVGVSKENYTDQVERYRKSLYKPWTKPQSVLILNGSPRVQKGYTHFFLSPFIEGIKKAGAQVEVVYLQKMKIKDCVGCVHCANPSGSCIYDEKDDFELVYNKQFQADLVVYAFPLFMDGMPALLKRYVDRTLPTDVPGQPKKECVDRKFLRSKKNQLLMAFCTCAYPEKENFDAVKQHMEQLSITKSMPVLEGVYRSSSTALYNNPLHYKKLSEIMQAIEMAGMQTVLYGKISTSVKNRLEQVVDTRQSFLEICNSYFFERMLKNDCSPY